MSQKALIYKSLARGIMADYGWVNFLGPVEFIDLKVEKA